MMDKVQAQWAPGETESFAVEPSPKRFGAEEAFQHQWQL
jgi:hypothetical protein